MYALHTSDESSFDSDGNMFWNNSSKTVSPVNNMHTNDGAQN